MKKHLEELSKRVTGDCFVCCVLTHGNEQGMYGSDDKILTIGDILSPFSGDRCPALAGKPKVFFIQACRGSEMQDKVKVQADDGNSSPDRIIYVPIYADFLISMSTFEGFVSLRNTEEGSLKEGSWFIQSLCNQLAESCPKLVFTMNMTFFYLTPFMQSFVKLLSFLTIFDLIPSGNNL